MFSFIDAWKNHNCVTNKRTRYGSYRSSIKYQTKVGLLCCRSGRNRDGAAPCPISGRNLESAHRIARQIWSSTAWPFDCCHNPLIKRRTRTPRGRIEPLHAVGFNRWFRDAEVTEIRLRDENLAGVAELRALRSEGSFWDCVVVCCAPAGASNSTASSANRFFITPEANIVKRAELFRLTFPSIANPLQYRQRVPLSSLEASRF